MKCIYIKLKANHNKLEEAKTKTEKELNEEKRTIHFYKHTFAPTCEQNFTCNVKAFPVHTKY